MDRIFPTDVMSKRERVEAALEHRPVDRVPLLEQLSYNPRVIADWTGRRIDGFNYTIEDICEVIRKTLDLAMPAVAPLGTARVENDGFVMQNDNWTSWHVSRPFQDEHGACAWLRRWTGRLREAPFHAPTAREKHRAGTLAFQNRIGDTVILGFSFTRFCEPFTLMGLEIYTFFLTEYPDVLAEFMETSTRREVQRVHAVADRELSPVILIPEDFATKQGPIFSPDFLRLHHYPYVKRLTDAWHEHGIHVLYHSDGNYKAAIPDLIACGADGFYCLEPNCGMDIVELKRRRPDRVWAGGVDGVDLMERGSPEAVRAEVRRHIVETRARETGGMFVASSSEINPPIPPANFRAMVEAVAEPAGVSRMPR